MLWIHINVCHICHKGASVLIYVRSEKKHVCGECLSLRGSELHFNWHQPMHMHSVSMKTASECLMEWKTCRLKKGRNERRLHKLCLFAFAIIPLRKESLCKGHILLMLLKGADDKHGFLLTSGQTCSQNALRAHSCSHAQHRQNVRLPSDALRQAKERPFGHKLFTAHSCQELGGNMQYTSDTMLSQSLP